MKKIRVNARAIVCDIKEHVGLKSLMEKHGLSYRHLLKVKEMLLEKGWVTRGELDYLNPADASAQITVQAKEFLASFRNRPDDFHLMDRFRLTAKDLRKIYERLIQAGLLSEYEYHCRDRKAPELEEPFTNLSEASTEVTLIKNVFDGGGESIGRMKRLHQELRILMRFVRTNRLRPGPQTDCQGTLSPVEAA